MSAADRRYLDRLEPVAKGAGGTHGQLVAYYAQWGLRHGYLTAADLPRLPRRITEEWLGGVLDPALHARPDVIAACSEAGRLTDRERAEVREVVALLGEALEALSAALGRLPAASSSGPR